MNAEDLSKGRRIVELGNEIEQLPGFKLHQEFFGLDITKYIFDRNFVDLSNVITFITTDPRGVTLLTVQNRKKREILAFEIIRGIYNYTAAACSFVEHTIKLYNRLYKKNNLFPEYHERVSSDLPLPLLKFIQDLRHYCQHIKSPVITFLTTDDGNGRLVTRVCIPLSDLQEYVEWKAEAKKFLATIQERLDVMEVLADFHNKEVAFYSWFRSRQEEIHADELKELDDKKDELRELMGDSYIPSA
jgi:hypothetical protein